MSNLVAGPIPFLVSQIFVGRADSVGRTVTKVYARRPPLFAVYEADDAVIVHFADDPQVEEGQRRLIEPLASSRDEMNALLRDRPNRELYDIRIAEALTQALSDRAVGAERLLMIAKLKLDEELAAERAAAAAKAAAHGRTWYLGTAVASGILLMTVLFMLSHGVYPEMRATVSQNVWLAAKAGVIGAWMSIAIGVSGRTLSTDGAWHVNAVDSALRMTLGAICGGLLLMIVIASTEVVALRGSLQPTASWMAVFLLGVLAGFSERLVPEALSGYVKAAAASGTRPAGSTIQISPAR